MRCFQSRIILVILGLATPALAEPRVQQEAKQGPANDSSAQGAAEDEPQDASRDEGQDEGQDEGNGRGDPPETTIAPLPGIDYPSALPLGAGNTLYVDNTYEESTDLSTFAWVRGHGSNERLALGGTLQVGELRLAAEVPLQYTRLHIDSLQDQPTADQDRDKVSFSLGDVILGAAYLWHVRSEAITFHGGFDIRARLPTHTTKYTFQLASGYGYEFGFPYYLHLAPGLVFALSSRYVSITVNQAVLGMLARDVSLSGIRQTVPNIFFWESHYAVAVIPANWLTLSLELVSCIQLNRVDDAGFTTLHDVKAIDLNPGVTVNFDSYRVALVARLGLTRGSQDFGVITFSGTRAALVRVSYVF